TRLPRFLIEPHSKDTAAAIAFALQRTSRKASFVTFISGDQWFFDIQSFRAALKSAESESTRYATSLFLLGTKPSVIHKSEYSRLGWMVADGGRSNKSMPVSRFVEKPNAKQLA